MPTEQQGAGSQLACRDCVQVSVHTSTSSAFELTVSSGFSCLAGNAGPSEIHPFVSSRKLETEDASRYCVIVSA